jgi:MYXO-CTERM domain-containing protein
MFKRCSSAVLALLAAVSCAESAAAAVLWEGDFETGDLSQWDSTNLIKTGERDNLILEGMTVAEGTTAAEITLREDVIFEPYTQSRVEVKHNGLHTLDGEDSYFAWSFMVPGDAEIRSNIGYWESTPSYKNTMTFFIEPGDSGTVVAFGTGDLGQNVQWSQALVLDQWHRVAIHNHWSQEAADGRVSVWYDGVQVVTDAVATKFNADQLFFQMGLHRGDPAPPVQVIYVDAAIEADSVDDILAPLPPLSTGGSGGQGGAAGSAGSAGGGMAGNSGSAGAPAAGTGGVSGGAGAAGAGGTSGGQGGAPARLAMPAASEPAACTVKNAGRSTPDDDAAVPWLLLGLAWLARRKRVTP